MEPNWWDQWCRTALRFCGCQPPMSLDETAEQIFAQEQFYAVKRSLPQYTCSFDCSEDLVKRQLAFRRVRKITRESSFNKLSSLATCLEDDEIDSPIRRSASSPAISKEFDALLGAPRMHPVAMGSGYGVGDRTLRSMPNGYQHARQQQLVGAH